ncbi:MAG: AAA family ATPase [Nitrospinota bacterium]
MYRSFFGLIEKPFNVTPDPRFLFLSKSHEEALGHLIYGIKERKGFIEITGEVGTGKTILCRSLLDELDKDVRTALILNPSLSEIELLKMINGDFGIGDKGNTKKELIDNLNKFLLDQLSEGKNAVLIIDEAQNLEPQIMEQIRLLSNLETASEKLIQIILVGQPELRENLALPNLRQLNQRISVRYYIKALEMEEIGRYIYHRLAVAGSRGDIKFTSSAIESIYGYSQGIPRKVNILCDQAFLAAYVAETNEIDHFIIDKSIEEIEAKGGREREERHESETPDSRYPFTGSMYRGFSYVLLLIFFTGLGWLLYSNIDKRGFMEIFPLFGVKHSDGEIITEDALLQGPGYTGTGESSRSSVKDVTESGANQEESSKVAEVIFYVESDNNQDEEIIETEETLMPTGVGTKEKENLILPGPPLTKGGSINFSSLIKGGLREDFKKGVEQQLSSFNKGRIKGVFSGEKGESPFILEEGMSGVDVKGLQRELYELGYLKEDPKGYFDENTKQAVIDFQRSFFLKSVDGKVGPETREVLNLVLGK